MNLEGALFLAALLLRLALIAFGEWQDANMAVKYTDIDYWVFTDAACSVASGGSPFDRSTYRYTPLLAWLLLPNCWIGKFWGKLIFSFCDLLAGIFIFNILARHFVVTRDRALKIVAAAWLFNPMVFTISTRGNAESLLCCLVLGTLFYLMQGKLPKAAILFGLSVHLKLFPAIYSFAFLHFIWNECWLAGHVAPSSDMKPSLSDDQMSDGNLKKSKSKTKLVYHQSGALRLRNFTNFCRRSWHLLSFAFFSLSAFGITTLPMLYKYGRQYLFEGFLYHLIRKDHRHNFSPFFLPFHLEESIHLPRGVNLAVFLPQLLLLLFIGFKFGRKYLPFACFLQTFVFVTFNKVCTSQYFLWYICLLPFVLVTLDKYSLRDWIKVGVAWFGAQAIWLKLAYDLEFAGKPVFTLLWLASILFMTVNTLIIHNFIKAAPRQ